MDYLQHIITITSEITYISESDIKSRIKKEDVVMARKLFVSAARNCGISTSVISEYLHISAQAVRNLYNQQDNRKIYAIYEQGISNKLANAK